MGCGEMSFRFLVFLRAYYKTRPGPICLKWPQSCPGLNFDSKVGPKQIFGLASKVGLASILASKEMFVLKFENIFFLSNFRFIFIEHPVIDSL